MFRVVGLHSGCRRTGGLARVGEPDDRVLAETAEGLREPEAGRSGEGGSSPGIGNPGAEPLDDKGPRGQGGKPWPRGSRCIGGTAKIIINEPFSPGAEGRWRVRVPRRWEVSTGQVGFFSVQLRKYCTWESDAPAGRSQVLRVIAWFSRTVTFSLTLSHVQSGSFCTWKVIQGVVLKAYSASAAVMVCSNVSRGRR